MQTYMRRGNAVYNLGGEVVTASGAKSPFTMKGAKPQSVDGLRKLGEHGFEGCGSSLLTYTFLSEVRC